MSKLKRLSLGQQVLFTLGTLCVMLLIIGGLFFFSLLSVERNNQRQFRISLQKKFQDMTERYRKFQRSWGNVVCLRQHHRQFGEPRETEKTEAVQKVNAMNETERQPDINLGLARVYLNATDPKFATRTCLHPRHCGQVAPLGQAEYKRSEVFQRRRTYRALGRS
jgi:hypothetical protein